MWPLSGYISGNILNFSACCCSFINGETLCFFYFCDYFLIMSRKRARCLCVEGWFQVPGSLKFKCSYHLMRNKHIFFFHFYNFVSQKYVMQCSDYYIHKCILTLFFLYISGFLKVFLLTKICYSLLQSIGTFLHLFLVLVFVCCGLYCLFPLFFPIHTYNRTWLNRNFMDPLFHFSLNMFWFEQSTLNWIKLGLTITISKYRREEGETEYFEFFRIRPYYHNLQEKAGGESISFVFMLNPFKLKVLLHACACFLNLIARFKPKASADC